MFQNPWTPKEIALAAAVVSVCVATALAIGLAYPEPIQYAALGPDWQCSRIALVWTTCSKVQQAASASAQAAKKPCPRPRT